MAVPVSSSTEARRLSAGLLLSMGCLIALFGGRADAQPPPNPSVRLVFYGDSDTYAKAIQRTFEAALTERLGGPVDFTPLFVDFSDERITGSDEALVDVVSRRYAARPSDLMVVQGPEALTFLLANRARVLAGVPIVFLDVLEGDPVLQALPADVTGVVTARPTGTVAAARQLVPGARHAIVVGGRHDRDRVFAQAIEDEIRGQAADMAVERLDGRSVEEQAARLAKAPADSLVFVGSFRSEGRWAFKGDTARRLSAASTAPLFGYHDYEVGHGLVGGRVVVMTELAERAADLAARILNGAAPASVTRVTAGPVEDAFDGRALDRWRLSEARLPPGSAVRFRPPTMWDQYRWPIAGTLAVVLLQSGLIVGLVVERRQRRRAQERLADAEQRYRTVADTGSDWEYWMQPDGRLLYVSPACEAITGYTAQEFEARPSLLHEIVIDEDRALWSAHDSSALQAGGPSRIQFRVRRRNGDIRWIEHACTPVVRADGERLGLRASNRDTTDRKATEEALHRALVENEELRDRLALDNAYLREQLQTDTGIEGLVGESDAMRYVTAKVRQVAATDTTVLLQGETGVGKSLVARAIHNLSTRRARPLVTVNCAALPPALVESELFGHEKGAFTGADGRRIGRFEIADGGSLFLDEIADLAPDLQAKLLRVVQTGEFERVGSSRTQRVDVRVIAATHRRLADEVAAGRFRQDLFYRLNVFPVTIPPLRKRREDIPAIVAHVMTRQCRSLGLTLPAISRSTMKALQERDWPGNIRELENAIERGLIAARTTGRFELDADEPETAARDGLTVESGALSLGRVERDHILAMLDRTDWRIEGEGGAAALLGMNASTLRSRMRKHGLRRPHAGQRPG